MQNINHLTNFLATNFVHENFSKKKGKNNWVMHFVKNNVGWLQAGNLIGLVSISKGIEKWGILKCSFVDLLPLIKEIYGKLKNLCCCTSCHDFILSDHFFISPKKRGIFHGWKLHPTNILSRQTEGQFNTKRLLLFRWLDFKIAHFLCGNNYCFIVTAWNFISGRLDMSVMNKC